MAKIIKADGAIIDVEPKNGKDFSLKELQSIVGGYIDIVYLKSGNILVVNDEGAINGMPLNKKATLLYNESLKEQGYNEPQYIFGNVLVCKSKEVK